MRKMDTRKKRCRLTTCCSVLVRRYTVMVVLVSLLVLLYWVHSVEHSWSLRLLATLPSHLSRAAPAQSRDNLNKEDIGQFLVDTPSCRIPNADAFDAALRPFINPPEPLDCRNGPPPLTYSDLDSVHLITERLHLYGASPPEVIISCCTHDISWFNSSVGVPPDVVSSGEQNIYLSAQCRPLTDRYTPETSGGVEVLCSKNGTLIYRNYHQFVPLLPDLEAVSLQRPAHAVMPSVLIFMFDSLSRLQFHRWFPRSRRLLYDEMDAFELGGLNKHGDNTWPNMLQMLTGMGQAELEALCAPNPRNDPLDNCPFIWREFKRAGYRTAMAEDCPDIGMFDYMKAGFIHQPTDYYNRPTALMAFRYIAHNVVLNTHLCDGTRPSYESTFTFAEHLATRLADRPYWGYVVQNAFSHDYFNMAYHLDEPFYRLLKLLLSTGALENTVLVTMGDHGLRWGAERETFVGGLEERLPLVSLYFPPWLRRRYPVAFANLRINQRTADHVQRPAPNDAGPPHAGSLAGRRRHRTGTRERVRGQSVSAHLCGPALRPCVSATALLHLLRVAADLGQGRSRASCRSHCGEDCER
ncbi:hypothetical protein FJT64_008216 [Amphibalanus amphitrite]|uniref:Uncharacterized protein n=1 Tax=Amphibalanus amphitrite TaxID=1232801 RepID=A0A6A4VJ49_AMPAM|nr:hypothetical protein FJT64_008216 [Amphibalanus amphitrite]